MPRPPDLPLTMMGLRFADGVFAILPGLDIWAAARPLLIASDVPSLPKPVGGLAIWVTDKWAALRQSLSRSRGAALAE
jgi:hypothetical protein